MPQDPNNYLFGTVVFFIVVYALIALDLAFSNIGFVITIMAMTMLGEYCAIQWIIDKRNLEKKMKKEMEINNE